METHHTEPIESYLPLLNSLDPVKTLPSPPNCTTNLHSELLSWVDNTLPESEFSDYDSYLNDTEIDDEDFEENEVNDLSPNSCISSHRSQPLSKIEDYKEEKLPMCLSVAVDSTDSNVTPSFVAMLSEIKPAIVGAGLVNLGNTCFLNAVMQCFTHTVPLLLGVISCEHKYPCYAQDSDVFCVLCALLEHVDLSLKCMGKYFYPWTLVNKLNYFSSGFERYQQEDAHEFLQCFLDKLENCWDNLSQKNTLLNGTSEGRNIVKQVFGGRLVSKLKCCNCGHCSDTYEPLVDVSLEIGDVETVDDALKSFTRVEKIEDLDTKFTCDNCKAQVFVEKQLMLDQIPSVATFHLKRFKSDGSFVEKIDKFVAFPLELDLSPYTADSETPNGELKHDLYAVVVHIGSSSNSGHYYSFIRSAPHLWYKLDDDQVTFVEEEFVLSQEAYILFYAKKGTQSFINFVESQKELLDIVIRNPSPKSVLDNIDSGLSSPSLPLESRVVDAHETGDATANEVSKETTNETPVLPSPVINSSPTVLPFNCTKIVPELKNLASVTPTRTPSPEIYREEPEQPYMIPRNHLMRTADQVSCKRQLSKELEDVGRKQARMYIKKIMSGSRSQQLLAAIGEAHSEGSANKKKRGFHQNPSSSEAKNSRYKTMNR